MRSRHRTSSIPPAHPTHSLLLDTIQSYLLPPDVNQQARDAFNTLLRDAPSFRANLPGLQEQLPEDGPPSKTLLYKKAQLQICPQPTARVPQYQVSIVTMQIAPIQDPTPSTQQPQAKMNGSQNLRKKRKKLLHTKKELQNPTIKLFAPNWDGNSIWKYKETSVKKLAQETTANHASNAVCYDFDTTKDKEKGKLCKRNTSSVISGKDQPQPPQGLKLGTP
eukprot:scaffold207705_cov20-Tisochrysis_lutea.AAC.1